MKAERAYGCYGYVATFNEESTTCQCCALRRACKSAAYKALKDMSAEIDVTSLIGRFASLAKYDTDPIRPGRRAPKNRRQKLKQYTQTKDEALLVMHLPVKQRRLVTSLHQKGIPVRNLIRGGANPFDKHRPGYMRVPCRLVIEQGGFTRPQLKQALLTEFPHWSENTAESHTSVAIGALVALKVVQKINDVYKRLD